MAFDVDAYGSAADALSPTVTYTDGGTKTIGTALSNKQSVTWTGLIQPNSLHDGVIAEAGGSNGWALWVTIDGTIHAANANQIIALNAGTYQADEVLFVAAVYELQTRCELWKNDTILDSDTPTSPTGATGGDPGAFLSVSSSSSSGSVRDDFSGVGLRLDGFDYALSQNQITQLYNAAVATAATYDPLTGQLVNPLGGYE